MKKQRTLDGSAAIVENQKLTKRIPRGTKQITPKPGPKDDGKLSGNKGGRRRYFPGLKK